ncbi:MAG: 30S ribosomal protein S6 [Elusimicrobia bacterium CG1_02_37_114]|nr:MAG: 30S ribosomal protein S6 [Elusimicrobia bacterium CG1_02_37_114]PIV53837.1 MAG: 30S ribosomal protein S6 [Elusimicrobia bacterium CG02_land_8_20_14_3_00_37_13]PIZ13619.1 MAG: 30S ribosomal protein S6 [Elusimicrobia bacterium CG_4_10_14_0_8_um_filter_37_32]
MTRYELIFVCGADFPAEKISNLTEKIKSIITQDGGAVVLVNEWGKRRLAYPISGYEEGIYTYLEFDSEGQVSRKVEDVFRNVEGVIRFLTVKKKKETKKMKKIQEKKIETKAEVQPELKTETKTEIKEEPIDATKNKITSTK